MDSFRFDIIEPDTLNLKIQTFKRETHPVFFNFYSADVNSKYEIADSKYTILVRKKEQDFYRLYVCSNSGEDLVQKLNNLGYEKYVINIPSKKGISEWECILAQTGFKFYAKYDRYYNTNIKKMPSRERVLATIDDVDSINCLLQKSLDTVFSKYTDNIPSKEIIAKMTNNQQIFVNKVESEILGVNIFTIEGKKCYLNLWYDVSGEGILLLFDVYNMMAERNIKYAYFWVNSSNKNVEKIHRRLGAKPDGISDYTFIKN